MRPVRVNLLLLFCAIAAIVAVPHLRAQDALNMTLFDHLNPVDSVGLHSALWGYTAPDGREYAIFGSQIGVHIIDVTEKPIRQVAYIWGPRNPWREMKVYKNYAYVVTEVQDTNTAQGVQIIDLSALPDTARLLRVDSTGFIAAHTVFIRDHYLYAMGTHRYRRDEYGRRISYGVDGAVIMDLEPDPTHPRLIGTVGTYYFHDAWVRNDTMLGAAVNGQGCDIWDIHDKANPVYKTTITYPYSGTHNAEMTTDGGYVLTTDEISATPKTLKVWDIHDLENISKVADYSTRPNDVIHNVHVKGRYAFCSWYTAGVRVIDVIDPVHPREVGFYDTYPGPTGSYEGVWEVFPYFPSGKIIISDRNTGLYVLTFNNAVAASVSGVVRNAETGAPMPGVRVTVPETGATVTSDAKGRYYISGFPGDALTLTTRQFGFQGTDTKVTLVKDDTLAIALEPASMVGLGIEVRDHEARMLDSFAFTIKDAYSPRITGNPTSVLLPRDSTFDLMVGRWGWAPQRKLVSAASDGEKVTFTLQPGYIDSVSLDLGWSFSDPSDGALTGRWVRTLPTLSGPYDWAYQPPTEPGGTDGYIFETGKPVYGTFVGTNDVNFGTTTLTSPRMDLSAMTDPTIGFDRWYVSDVRDSVRDTFRIQLSNDDGMSWKTVFSEIQGRPGWKRYFIFAKDELPLTDRMRVRFRASDTLGNISVVAAVDNFEVYETRPTSSVRREAEANAAGSITVTPNPAAGHPTITIRSTAPAERLRLELVDALGTVVATLYDGPVGDGRLDLKVRQDLPAGWYMARIVNGERVSFSQFLICK